jgi:pimeloyl-ACP methyl ester carboxylesterase
MLLRRRLSRFDLVDAERWLRLTLARNCVDPALVSEQRVAEGAIEMLHCLRAPEFPQAMLATLRSCAASFLRSYLPGSGSLWHLTRKVTAPTLLIWGEKDSTFPVRLAPRLAEAIPGSRVVILENVGHIPHLETPRFVARAFLAARGDVGI